MQEVHFCFWLIQFTFKTIVMRKNYFVITVILFFLAFPFLGIGQDNSQDVVYLKNGSIIHGIIIEQVPFKTVKIQTKDGNVFVYKMEEIEKVTKEQNTGQPSATSNAGSTYNAGSKSKSSSKSFENEGLSIGMKLGIDLSSWSNVDVSGSMKKPSKLGFQGGFIAKYGINKFLGVQAELLFAQKGMKIKATQGNVTVKSWVTVNYLEIPILTNFTFPVGPVVLMGNIGPYFGIGLTANLATDPDVGLNQKVKFENGSLKRFDMGLLFGAGVGYKIGKGLLFMDLRYGLGLSDINDIDDADKGTSYEKNSNRNFGISFGYLIPIGK
jgi:hypothetical protein